MTNREKLLYALGAIGGIWIIRNLHVMLLGLPDEAAQGAIYRIIYFHVPSWFTCFTAYFAAAVGSILYLVKKDPLWDTLAVATVEVGIAFTVVGLVTGSIWARIIWGIWWTWDARLTWALITCIVYMGYLMLRNAFDDPTARAKNAAVLCIFAFASVVITFKAIDWWRTQHPGPVLSIRTGGGSIDTGMENMIYSNWPALMCIAIVLVALRMRQEELQREVEALRRHAHAL